MTTMMFMRLIQPKNLTSSQRSSLATIAARTFSTAPSHTASGSSTYRKRLSVETMCPNLVKMEYAVRGKVVVAADKISQELASTQKDGSTASQKYPFDHIVYTNIGNPHALGQKPLTWPRQVLALVELPSHVGVDHPEIGKLFPADAIRRAREIKQAIGGHGSGVYTHSKGVKAFREEIAQFIEQRDGGVPADPETIYLTNGASQGITLMLNMLVANDNTGVMIPIPQYPIYSAAANRRKGDM